MARRLQLSLAEKRVNQVVAESQATNTFRHSAARVLQYAWLMLKWQRRAENGIGSRSRDVAQFRLMQRQLLMAVIEFRRCRWKLRMRMEEEDEYILFRKSYTETQDRLARLRQRQLHMGSRLRSLIELTESMVVAKRNSNTRSSLF